MRDRLPTGGSLLIGALRLIIVIFDPVLPIVGPAVEAPGLPVGFVIGVHLVGVVIQFIFPAQSIPPAGSCRNGSRLPMVTIPGWVRPGAQADWTETGNGLEKSLGSAGSISRCHGKTGTSDVLDLAGD